MAACAKHERNAAVASCQRCGGFVCALCRIFTDRFVLCPGCFERGYAAGALGRTLRSMPHFCGATSTYVAGDIDLEGVIRRRVFYEDIVFVTYHRAYGAAYVAGLTALLAGMLMMSAALLLSGYLAAAGMMFAASAVAALPLFLRVVFQVDVVTVFGKRSRAVLRFHFKKQLGRQVFQQICDSAREKQAQLAAQLEARL